MPAKSKHMERRKQRIANAKKNARLAAKLRRRRQLQAAFGLLAIAVLSTAGFLWMTGFFETEEPAVEDPVTSEITDLPTDMLEEEPTAEGEETPAEGEDGAEGDETPAEDATDSETDQ